MFIPLDAVADSSIAQQVGGGAGILAFLTVVVREVLSYLSKRRERIDVVRATENPGKNPGNDNNSKINGTSTTNLVLNMIRENHEDMEKINDRLRNVEVTISFMQATCAANHVKK